MVRFVHYNSMTTWQRGRSTCRENHHDLVAVTSSGINSAVRGLVAEGTSVWIGLFKDAWEWSDGHDTSFRSWVDGGDSDGDCATISMESRGFWTAKDCAAKMPFVCEGGLKTRKTLVKIQMFTTAPPNPEVIIEQLSNQLKTNGVSDFKLSWKRGKDGTIFQRAPTCDKKKPQFDVEVVCSEVVFQLKKKERSSFF
ncbi:C-type lectin 1-like [Eucyclogobius newberryi]|uniref:C-type lectin 1-like n=1 Tax=Eucyclogobius newberryi TaxID=166745 RepID=UPI003B5995B6